MTTTASCAEVRRWLAGPGTLSAPPPHLAAHVAGCERCRGALATLYAQLLGAPPPAGGCTACEADLPAFVELERASGQQAAARRYPQLWWHLWTCADCAEAAEGLVLLLQAEADGLLDAPPALAPRLLPALPPLRLDRGFLHAVFGPQLTLGAAWHEDEGPLVLAEEELPGHHVVIQVRQEAQGTWCLEISVEPPVIGVVVVSFAETIFRAPLVGGRAAQLRGIPSRLISDSSGPDMTIALERDHGAP